MESAATKLQVRFETAVLDQEPLHLSGCEGKFANFKLIFLSNVHLAKVHLINLVIYDWKLSL